MTQTKVTWHGHACFTIDMGTKIVVDPFLNGNPKADITPDKVKADIVVVTHGHSDHLGDAVEICKNNSAELVTMVELAWKLAEENPDLKVHDINISGSATIKGVRVSSVQAVHSSTYNGEFVGPPMGVVIGRDSRGHQADSTSREYLNRAGHLGEFRIYHAGDTGVFKDMELIGDYYKPDLSMLPIGGHYTMGPEEAAIACRMIRSRYTVPMHYNTFDKVLSDPGVLADLTRKDKSTEVIVAEIGKEMIFDDSGKMVA